MEMALLVLLVASSVVAGVSSAAAWKLVRARHEETAARVEALRILSRLDEASAMFGASTEPSAPKRRWVALAAVAVLMASIAGTAFALHEDPASASSRPMATPIELLRLQATAGVGGTLVVAGQVRASTPDRLNGVLAQVDLIDARGSRLATGAMPFSGSAGAGVAPSFSVALATPARVVRYRVQFRREDGSIVPHLDRRGLKAERGVERTGDEYVE